MKKLKRELDELNSEYYKLRSRVLNLEELRDAVGFVVCFATSAAMVVAIVICLAIH